MVMLGVLKSCHTIFFLMIHDTDGIEELSHIIVGLGYGYAWSIEEFSRIVKLGYGYAWCSRQVFQDKNLILFFLLSFPEMQGKSR